MPCSTSIIAATLVTGLLIEAIQKIASDGSGTVLARSRKPTARRYATLPLRAIAATAPEKPPASTCVCCQAAIRASRVDEKPRASTIAHRRDGVGAGGGGESGSQGDEDRQY